MGNKRTPPPQDYMKYWRVVRYYVKSKYKLTTADLDMLLFLFSEQYFNKSKFKEFNELTSWDRNRFYRLLKEGWIVKFRERKGKEATLYEISYKGKRMVQSVYDKLNGDGISENRSVNPMFLKNVKYEDKVYRNFIKKINETTRQQQRLSQQ